MLEGMWVDGDAMHRDLATMTQRIRLLGFNAIRLPFSMKDLFNLAPKYECSYVSIHIRHFLPQAVASSKYISTPVRKSFHVMQVMQAAMCFPYEQAALGLCHTSCQWAPPSSRSKCARLDPDNPDTLALEMCELTVGLARNRETMIQRGAVSRTISWLPIMGI